MLRENKSSSKSLHQELGSGGRLQEKRSISAIVAGSPRGLGSRLTTAARKWRWL